MKKENVLVIVLIVVALGGIYVYNALQPAKPTGGSSVQSADVAQNASLVANASANTLSDQSGTGIAWKDYTPGMAQAKKSDRPIFLYFGAPWCTYCTKLKKTTFKDTRVTDYLNRNFVSIQVNTDNQRDLAKKWRIKGLPTMWFLESDGDKVNSLPGYVGADQFLQILKYIHTGSYTTMEFQEFVKQS
ncbi:MAG: thioredoxin fold domain-containing protein [Desulfobacterales bacterium]|nr:thioredoxin fold domain-containing protein [Desulfobacterales bacterium]